MDYSANKVREQIPSMRESVKKSKGAEAARDSKEISEAAELGREAYVEAAGLDEAVETTGNVSEVLKESVEESVGGVAVRGGGRPSIDFAKIRSQLLEKMPGEVAMKKEIEREIKKEIKYLHKKAIRMLRSPGSMSYFEMANLMKKIRELKGVLLKLVKISLEGLKTLWLRYVHGL